MTNPGKRPVQTPGDEPNADPAAAPAATSAEKRTIGMDAPRPQRLSAKPEELPDQSEVDPSKIKRPVLTKQGWVTPLDTGRPPRF